MSQLSIYPLSQQPQPQAQQQLQDPQAITQILADKGIVFERWQPQAEVTAGDEPAKILAAFSQQIEQLQQSGGYQQVDVISLNSTHPDKAALRQKFLAEHTHSEDEVRFFVAGQGLFCFHLDDGVYQLLCQKDDLISVPANTKHWFDMGSEPDFVAIRLFIDPAGWVANLTGDDIAEHYPLLA